TSAGSTSVRATPVASLGPLLVRVTVKVTVSPTLGVGLSTVLVTARSASGGVMSTLPVLFVLSGSNVFELATATLVAGAALFTWAVITSVAVALSANVPKLHTPVAGSYNP